MNKLFTSIAAVSLGLTMAIGVGTAVGTSVSKEAVETKAAVPSTSEVAYEVVFEKGTNDSGTAAPAISSGDSYATIGTTSKAYKRTKGLHLGSNSAVGSQIINFTTGTNGGQIQATYLSVYAIQVDSGKSLKTTITYTDSTTSSNTTATGSSLSYIDIQLTSSKTISSVKFESVTASKGRVAVDSFKVYKEKATETYTVSFNGNGATGSMSSVTDVSGTYTLPSNGFDVPTGKAFAGWKANNAGDLIAAGGSYTVSANVEFYAQWADAYKVTYEAGTNGTGSFEHNDQPAGSYTLLPFANLTGVSANTGYRFKNYTVDGVDKNPGDSITLGAATTVTVNFEEKPQEVTFDFTDIDGFSSWGSSYSSHTVTYTDYGDVIFRSASRQTSNITNQPVTKGADTVDFIGDGILVTSASFVLTQWTTKTKTVELFYSTDGGDTYTTTGTTSSSFSITVSSLPTGTNAIRLDFSEASNQVGITSLTIGYAYPAELDYVTTSGQKESFDYAEEFSYGGTLTAYYTQGKAPVAGVTPSIFKYGESGIDPDSAGTVLALGTPLIDSTHNGKYVYVGYTEDDGATYKWTDGYQISVGAAPTYYMVLNAYTDTGTNYGYKGGIIEIDVTESNLAGNITWSVTSGSVSEATYDNDGYMATLASAGTLTITATDSGYAESTHTITITVVDSLSSVMAPTLTPGASTLEFTAACGGSGTADDGATWAVTSDGDESTYDSARGIHYGTNKASVQYVQLTSDNAGAGNRRTIRSVVVNATDAADSKHASLTVTVGGKTFYHNGNESVTLGGQDSYTFSGSATGEIVVKADRGEAVVKAIYVKSVVVNYVTASETTSDIANATGMHKAQQAVIDYANDFLDTLDDICVAYGSTNVTDLTNAWGNLATQYDNWFNKGAKDLSTDEIAQAKNLFAYASDNKTGDVLQRMVDQYDWIVSHYDLSNFLSSDAGRESLYDSTGRVAILVNVNSSNIIPIIVIVSLISVSAIGGYFYIRRRKEQ